MDKSLTSVHAVPFQDSVLATTGSLPPKNKPAVTVPHAPPAYLPVLFSVVSVQVEPFHCSTIVAAGGPPFTAKAAVEVPNQLFVF